MILSATIKKLLSVSFVCTVLCFLSVTESYCQDSQMGYTDYNLSGLSPVKLTNGNHTLRLGTIISSYLDFRQYPSGATPDLTKNTFKPKDARIDIKGNVGEDYEYHLQLDFASWGSVYAPDAQPLDDANITYKGFRKLFNITFGYGKVPYSLNSLVEHYESPYWERPQITKGDFMSRRDLGIKFSRSFWDKRIRAAAGIYTGVGEVALGGTNDPSGAFEYMGRLEVSYPENHNEEIIDTKGLKTPNISIGLNGRYTKRNLPAGASFLAGEQGAMLNGSDSLLEVKVVNGEKYILGADVSIEYRGFSVQLEGHTLKGTPQKANDPLLLNLPASKTGGYFKSGGWYVQANYFSKPIKTIFSVRYDEMNANDLVTGVTKHFASSISYQIKGFNSMLRAEYDQSLQFNPATLRYGGEAINTTKWHNEFRIGWQLVID